MSSVPIAIYSSISAIGAFSSFDPSAIDYLQIDPTKCTGGEDPPLRTTVEPAPGQDGALILPPFDDAWVITLAGDLIINSAGDEAGYVAARSALQASLKAALDSLKAAPGDLAHGDGFMSVWKYSPISSSYQGALKSVTFGLVVDVFA